jgi:hypothetical protein
VACLALLSLPHLGTVPADADLWWHVRAGQWIWTTGAVPAVDPWSYATSGPWIDHEWLAHLLLALAWQALGDTGLLLLRDLTLVLAVVALGWAIWDRWPNPVGVLGLVGLSVPLLAAFVNTRPQGWTYALLAVMLALAGAAGRGRSAALWAWPGLLVLWVNLHGGFAVGWGLAGLYLLGLGISPAGRSPGPRRLAILLAMAAVVAAPLTSPYGIDLVRYVASEIGASHSILFEWQPPTGLLRAWGLAWVVIPLAAFAAGAGPPARWSPLWPAELVALGVSAGLMLRSNRFLALVVVLGPVVLATALGGRADRGRRRRLTTLAAASQSRVWALAVVALAVLSGLASELPGLSRHLGHVSVTPGSYPRAAVRFLAQEPLGPRLATSLAWGGFAIWHLGDRYRVSIDGRNVTAYSAAYVDRYLLAWYRGDLRDILAERGADVMLVETGGALHATLARDRRWGLAFQSPVGSVFVPAARWTRPPVIVQEADAAATFPG